MKDQKMNRYRNPWCKILNAPKPEFYENDARKVFEYRGVSVFKLNDDHFDYVLSGCCITQRAGFKPQNAPAVIDDLLDGQTPCCDEVAAHIAAQGGKPMTYEQYSEKVARGVMA